MLDGEVYVHLRTVKKNKQKEGGVGSRCCFPCFPRSEGPLNLLLLFFLLLFGAAKGISHIHIYIYIYILYTVYVYICMVLFIVLSLTVCVLLERMRALSLLFSPVDALE